MKVSGVDHVITFPDICSSGRLHQGEWDREIGLGRSLNSEISKTPAVPLMQSVTKITSSQLGSLSIQQRSHIVTFFLSGENELMHKYAFFCVVLANMGSSTVCTVKCK